MSLAGVTGGISDCMSEFTRQSRGDWKYAAQKGVFPVFVMSVSRDIRYSGCHKEHNNNSESAVMQ